jgi:nucleoside 2-deoxyribosyltransferase
MKIYLASTHQFKYDVTVVADFLAGQGISYTVKWWDVDLKEELEHYDDDKWFSDPKVKEWHDRDLKGIDEADALILVCPTDKPFNFNGANVELGYAKAKGKSIFSIGCLARSAMYYGIIRCHNLSELVKHLQRLKFELEA